MRNLWRAGTLLFLAWLVFVLPAGAVHGDRKKPSTKATEVEVQAWVCSGTDPWNNLRQMGARTVKVQWAISDKYGMVMLDHIHPDERTKSDLRQLDEIAKKKLLCWLIPNRASLEKTIESRESRRLAIGSVMDFVQLNGFNGLELDAEGWWQWLPTERNSKAFKNWLTFLQELRKALGKDKWFAVCTPAITKQSQATQIVRYKDFLLADEIIPMAYDHQYTALRDKKKMPPNGVPITPTEWLEDVCAYIVSQVPLSKITMGHAAYGSIAPQGATVDKFKYATYAEILTHLDGIPATKIFLDAASQERYTVRDGLVLRFADSRTLQHRFRVAAKYGIRRASVWRIGGNPQLSHRFIIASTKK